MGASRNTPRRCGRPPKLFHGTTAKMSVGDELVGGLTAKTSRSPWVWMDNNAEWAAGWGEFRALRTCVQAAEPVEVYVYEVEPIGEVQIARGAWRARSARVVGLVDIRQVWQLEEVRA